jgi:hypothetical protein
MASYTVTLAGGTLGSSGEKTTSGSTADTATLAGTDAYTTVEIDCTASTGYVDVRLDGTAAVKGAAGTIRVKADRQVAFPASWCTAGAVPSSRTSTYPVEAVQSISTVVYASVPASVAVSAVDPDVVFSPLLPSVPPAKVTV